MLPSFDYKNVKYQKNFFLKVSQNFMNPREKVKKNFNPKFFWKKNLPQNPKIYYFATLQRCTLKIAILLYTTRNCKFNGANLLKSLKCEGAPSGFMGDDIPPENWYYPANMIYLSYIPHKHKEYITPPGNSHITQN